MPNVALVCCRHQHGTITMKPVPCDGCDVLLTAAEIACGETLCEECRAEDDREEDADDAR